MKRNKFLLAMVTTIAAPLTVLSRQKIISEKPGKAFKVKAGEGRRHGHIQLKGVNANVLDVKVSGTDNDGALAIFEQTSLSQGRGTPLHIHHFQDEVFYVVEGEYYFQVGEEKFNLIAGDYIFMPKKIPHAWTQVSAKGKMEVTFQPAGKMEDFFLTIAALKSEPTKEIIEKIFADNEMEIVGPPLKII